MIKPYFYNMYSVIQENISLQAGNFKFSFESSQQDISARDIHHLRVSVKRIRALIRMNKDINQETSLQKGSIKYLRKIFKSAALLRDLYIISIITAENFASLQEDKYFKKFFIKQEKAAKRRYKKSVKYKEKAYKEFDTIQLRLQEEIFQNQSFYENNNIDLVIKKRQSQINEIISGDMDDHRFHKFRIRLKEINHIMTLRNDESKTIILEQLLFIAKVLGNWHDHIIFLEFFKRFQNSIRHKGQNKFFNRISEIDFGYCTAEKAGIISNTKNIYENYLRNLN